MPLAPPPIPSEQSLITYPSAFPIKVMGAQVEGFEAAIVAVALRFDPTFDASSVERRPSKAGNYLGLNYGRVMRISETEVVVREIVQDSTGEWTERPAALQLVEGNSK